MNAVPMETPDACTCANCGARYPSTALNCPVCHRLTHASTLRDLGERAAVCAANKDVTAELAAWREALDLLPQGSHQHAAVEAKIAELTEAVSPAQRAEGSGHAQRRGFAKKTAGLGALGLLLWKLKSIIAFVLTKGKLLVMGLTKTQTALSMLLALGVYWTVFGWKFALGLVLSIYVHEIGHVAALRQLGIAASAPMFIPGLGAVVRMKQYPNTPHEDAQVGLAGPVWGLGAALLSYAIYLATGLPLMAAIARIGAWINLFNLLPIWQLDGGRGFSALNRRQRWQATAVIAAAWFFSEESLLLLLGMAAAFRAAAGQAPERPGRYAFWVYCGLVVSLSWMTMIGVPGLPAGT